MGSWELGFSGPSAPNSQVFRDEQTDILNTETAASFKNMNADQYLWDLQYITSTVCLGRHGIY